MLHKTFVLRTSLATQKTLFITQKRFINWAADVTKTTTAQTDLVTVPGGGSRPSASGNVWNVIEFSPQGNVRLVDFMRSDLYTKFGLQGRDVRVLISNINYPTILSRQRCIIADIKNISGIIAGDRFLLIKNDDLDPGFVTMVQNELKYHYLGKAGKTDTIEAPYLNDHAAPLPFEFLILECILHKVCGDVKKEFEKYMVEVKDIISSQLLGSSEQVLYDIMQKKQQLNRFTTFVRELHESLEGLLQSDEDMANMYLSEKLLYGRNRDVDKHEEVEMLLENYYTQMEDVMNRIEELKSDINSTQEFIEICLDSIRNRMMQMELKISIAGVALTCGTLIAGLFGMNLVSHLETSPIAFYVASGSIVLLATAIFMGTLIRCKRMGIFDFKYVFELKKKMTRQARRDWHKQLHERDGPTLPPAF